MATLFEKIASGEVAAKILFRDDKAMVIRDIAPQAPLHLLAIPIRPIASLADAAEEDCNLLGHLLLVARKVARELCDAEDFRIVINSGESAGQSVQHLHVHLLAGRQFSWPPG